MTIISDNAALITAISLVLYALALATLSAVGSTIKTSFGLR
jgi:hypothetical protein